MSIPACRNVFPLCRALIWLLLLSIMPMAAAVQEEQTLAGLHHSTWTTREGAPGSVLAITQTSDGYLWIASQVGLYRFDGMRFERFNPLPGQAEIDGSVQSLYAPPGGGLWVGMYYGGIHFVSAGKVSSYGTAEGLPKRSVTAIAQDLSGRMWLTTTKGLYRLENGRWVRQDAADDAPDALLTYLVVDREGTLWATGYGPAMLSLRRGESRVRAIRKTGDAAEMILDRRGVVWKNDEISLSTLGADGARVINMSPFKGYGKNDRLLLSDSHDFLWMTLNGKFVRVARSSELVSSSASPSSKVESLNVDDLMSGPSPRTAFEDREGNVWVATHGGLDRFRRNKLSSPFADDTKGLTAAPALVAADDGTVWAGTMGNGLIKIGEQIDFTQFLIAEGNRAGINHLYRDPSGTFWLAGRGELWHSNGEEFARVDPPFGGAPREVQAVWMDAEASLWVLAPGFPPWVRKKGAWVVGGAVEGLPAASPLTIGSDGKRTWLGYADNRIAVVDQGRTRMLDDAQGLAIGSVMVIHSKQDVVWVGGQSGLALYRSGRFRQVATRNGLKLRGISGIAQTASGEMWLNGADGVVRISAGDVSELLKNSDHAVDTEVLDVRDGLKGIAAQSRPLGTALLAADGRVWFTTLSGIFWIDPARIGRSSFKPPVIIDSMLSDDRIYRQGQDKVPSVAGRNVQFNYTSTSLTMPERIRFRYRLDGLDSDWHDAGGRRQAFYTNLRPGSYRFEVVAVNADGVGSQDAAAFAFDIPPAFYETSWFRVLVGLAFAAMAGGLYRVRLRQVAARVRRDMEARHEERERIARDLHDTILQETQGLVLGFQALAQRLPSDDEMRRAMEGLLDRADDTLSMARQTVSGLRATETQSEGLVHRFEALVAEFAPSNIAVKLTVDGTEPRLTDRVGHEVYLIGREAVLNALRHSRASTVAVVLSFASRRLRLSVRDDGVGLIDRIGDAVARPGHWGLVGMRERAAHIGAELSIQSVVGQGTAVELDLATTDAAWHRFGTFLTHARRLRRRRQV